MYKKILSLRILTKLMLVDGFKTRKFNNILMYLKIIKKYIIILKKKTDNILIDDIIPNLWYIC